jgi:hypothetical protein
MSIPSCGLSRDDHAIPAENTSALAEALALLAALGWMQALFRIKEVQRILAISRASIYRDIAASELEVVKVGTATRITAQSLARRIAELRRAGALDITKGRNIPGTAGTATETQTGIGDPPTQPQLIVAPPAPRPGGVIAKGRMAPGPR